MGRRDIERGSKIGSGATTEAIAAARKSALVPILTEWRLSMVVGMLLRAGLVVSVVQMKRSMGVAADKSERQEKDQAAQKQGSLHGMAA